MFHDYISFNGIFIQYCILKGILATNESMHSVSLWRIPVLLFERDSRLSVFLTGDFSPIPIFFCVSFASDGNSFPLISPMFLLNSGTSFFPCSSVINMSSHLCPQIHQSTSWFLIPSKWILTLLNQIPLNFLRGQSISTSTPFYYLDSRMFRYPNPSRMI